MGFSTDHIQNLLSIKPECIDDLLVFMKLIADGDISYAVQDLFLERGVPIQEKGEKIRPIAIDCPFNKLACHILHSHVKEEVILICGDNQLGNAIKGAQRL
jgi:hypothetical protein